MRAFLVCYDYGTGGVWLYLNADSASDITKTYRDLVVFETPPPWWTEEMEKHTRGKNAYDPFWSDWLKAFER